MSIVSLQDVEKSLYTLWTKRDSREDFISGSVPEGVTESIAEEIDVKGINLYSSLIRAGQNDLMYSVYPGCANLIGKGFEDMVAKYYEHSPPDHFNFNRGASRFSEFLEEHGDRYLKRYPFIPELADYEWIELEILEHPAKVCKLEAVELNSPEVFDQYGPVVNEALAIRKYRYPITRIVDWLKEGVKLPRRVKKEAVELAVFRSSTGHEAKFLELGETALIVVEAAIKEPTSYSELIKLAVQSQPDSDPQQVVVEFLGLVEKLREVELFLGSEEI